MFLNNFAVLEGHYREALEHRRWNVLLLKVIELKIKLFEDINCYFHYKATRIFNFQLHQTIYVGLK